MTTSNNERGIGEYVTVFRRRWLLIALIFAVTVGAAAAYTFTQEPIYRSSMKIVVGQGEGIFLPESGNVAEQFTQTMSNLLKTDVVAGRVIQRLNLDMTPDQLLEDLHVVTTPQAAVLQVQFDNKSRFVSRQVLAEVAKVFTELVDERLAAASAGTAATRVSATIFDPAHLLPDPVAPKPTRSLAVAALLGILCGAVGALIRERFDDTVRTTAEAEQAFGQVIQASLPPGLVGLRPFHPAARRRVDPLLAERSFERLGAGVFWSRQPNLVRSVLVTSPASGEGKTTVAANLAVVLATEGHDVIIVEGDLRRPALHSYLATWPREGVSGVDAVLSGQVEARDALVEVPIAARSAGLSLNGHRGNGSIPPQPSGELVQGRLRAILTGSENAWPPDRLWPAEFSLARTSGIVRELSKMCEFVIVDAPPLLVVTDAYQFVGATDSILAVVRNNKTSASAVQEMARILERLEAKHVQLTVTEADARFESGYYYRHPQGAGEGRQEQRTKG